MALTVILPALGSAVFFGLALVLTRLGLRHMGPLRGACVSIPTTTIVFVILAPVTVGFENWHAGGAGLFAVVGCLFPATVTLLTFSANRRIGPNLTGALGNLAPLFAVVIAVMVLGEAPDVGQIAAIAVIVAGVVLLFWAPGLNRADSFVWVILLPVAAAFIRGLAQPVVKLGLEAWPNPFAAVTIGYLVSTLVVLSAGAIKDRRWPVPFDRGGWLWFSAVGVCNGVAVFGMYSALARGPVTLVAPLVACYPVATLALSRILLGSASLTRRMAIGVGITVAGVVLLLRA